MGSFFRDKASTLTSEMTVQKDSIRRDGKESFVQYNNYSSSG